MGKNVGNEEDPGTFAHGPWFFQLRFSSFVIHISAEFRGIAL
jgi:hypothetical protein